MLNLSLNLKNFLVGKQNTKTTSNSNESNADHYNSARTLFGREPVQNYDKQLLDFKA